MTDMQLATVVVKRLKSARGWMAVAVVAAGVAAWVAVAWSSSAAFDGSRQRDLVGVAVVAGTAEAAYLAWRNWSHWERRLAGIVTGAGIAGAALVALGATLASAGPATVSCASGIGVLGIGNALGLFGLYRATGKSSAATLTAMVIVVGLAYVASLLWGAVSE